MARLSVHHITEYSPLLCRAMRQVKMQHDPVAPFGSSLDVKFGSHMSHFFPQDSDETNSSDLLSSLNHPALMSLSATILILCLNLFLWPVRALRQS